MLQPTQRDGGGCCIDGNSCPAALQVMQKKPNVTSNYDCGPRLSQQHMVMHGACHQIVGTPGTQLRSFNNQLRMKRPFSIFDVVLWAHAERAKGFREKAFFCISSSVEAGQQHIVEPEPKGRLRPRQLIRLTVHLLLNKTGTLIKVQSCVGPSSSIPIQQVMQAEGSFLS